MKTRSHFPLWLSINGYKNMAEVGVFRGSFSSHILKHWTGNMVLIDSWCHFKENYDDFANLNDEDHEKNYQLVLNMVKNFPDRATVVRGLSLEAAESFPDGYFDVVYLDSNHSYNHVMAP